MDQNTQTSYVLKQNIKVECDREKLTFATAGNTVAQAQAHIDRYHPDTGTVTIKLCHNCYDNACKQIDNAELIEKN